MSFTEQALKVSAILVAAGSGIRFTSSLSPTFKQFLPLDGRPMFLWSLTVLLKHHLINRVVVVVPPGLLSRIEEKIEGHVTEEQKRRILIIEGGESRQESVYRALKKLAELEESGFAIIHDAVRPYLTKEMVSATIRSVIENGACTTAIPVTDTIKRVEAGMITETVDRSRLFQIQTPQAGRLDWLLAGHAHAQSKQIKATDDATILELSGHAVSVVPGSPLNLKITNQEDMVIAEAIAPHFV